MKLFFDDKLVSWSDSFDIFDEIGRKLFRVEAKQGAHRLTVYATSARRKNVATIRESSSNNHAVTVRHGSRFVAAVRRAASRMKQFFDLGFLGWFAQGDFADGSFSILDANARIVANVNHSFFLARDMRCIDSRPEFYLHSLTFTLAIDVQTSQPTPVQAVQTVQAVQAVQAVQTVQAGQAVQAGASPQSGSSPELAL